MASIPPLSFHVVGSPPARTEEVKITLGFDYDACQRLEDPVLSDLATIFGPNMQRTVEAVQPGDTLRFNYSFHAGYFGNICRGMNALIRVLDSDVAVEANLEELNHGKCLIDEVSKALAALKARITRREKEKDEDPWPEAGEPGLATGDVPTSSPPPAMPPLPDWLESPPSASPASAWERGDEQDNDPL